MRLLTMRPYSRDSLRHYKGCGHEWWVMNMLVVTDPRTRHTAVEQGGMKF